jgi:hypothetical protein
MVDVGLARDLGVPVAGRQPLHARQRVAAGALDVVLVEELGEVAVGVDDADDVVRREGHGGGGTHVGHVGSLTSAPRRGSGPRRPAASTVATSTT